MPQHECPACRVTMTDGFIIDRAHHGTPSQQEWVEGEPVKSFWVGLKLKGREKIAVRTYRCPRCGLLQSFAA